MEKYEFIIASQERVDALTALLRDEVLPGLGLFLRGAAARDLNEGKDWARYNVFEGVVQKGQFNFDLGNRVYQCSVENRGLNQEAYEHIVRTVQARFPETNPDNF